MLELLLPIILLVIVLVSIHSWFGLHIIKRGIIFTDLAIGQIAAVGSAISVSFFHAEHLYLWTLSFALFGAFLITFAVHRLKHIESFIGLIYVLGASSVMLVLTQNPEGSEHFSALLATDILFTSTEDIIKSIFIYMGVALALRFILPRFNGLSYELLFFTLLGVTVTSSVQLVGVLVVFVFLIAPALIGLMQARFNSYLVALVVGSTFSISAIVISFYLDLPTGYAIVFLGAILGVVASFIFPSAKKETY